jgi:cytochrome c
MRILNCPSIIALLLLTAPACGFAADVGLRQGLSALAARQHCDECHAMKDARIGPPFVAVAARYPQGGDATVNRLALKIINGGAGNWGTIPMDTNERISMADARAIARWILTLDHNG